MVVCIKCPLLRHPLCPRLVSEAIPIPADQPIMQIRDLEEVTIPTMEIKVKYNLKTYRERELCCFQSLYKVLLCKCFGVDACFDWFGSYLSCKQVDPSGAYENLVTVRSFMPHYHLAGGVNLPKIIDCVGSDGKSRRQLVKVSVRAFVCVLCSLLTCFFLSF